MTARASMESATWEALARHGRAVADGTPARVADPQLVDAILKAADRYALTEQQLRALQRRLLLDAAHPSDTSATTRRRRAELDDARSQAQVAAIKHGKKTSA